MEKVDIVVENAVRGNSRMIVVVRIGTVGYDDLCSVAFVQFLCWPAVHDTITTNDRPTTQATTDDAGHLYNRRSIYLLDWAQNTNLLITPHPPTHGAQHLCHV